MVVLVKCLDCEDTLRALQEYKKNVVHVDWTSNTLVLSAGVGDRAEDAEHNFVIGFEDD